MALPELQSAVLLTPGRASYVTTNLEGGFDLNLTAASAQRSEIAADEFNPDFHTIAAYVGGCPGIAQDWPPEHVPQPGSGEGSLLARPLESRLHTAGWSDDEIAGRVKIQDRSNNSIDDVIKAIEQGILDPNDFNQDGVIHGIDLVTGVLHGIRFQETLSKGLDANPRLIRRVPMHDPYGTPATEFRPRETAPKALLKEYAAIAITRFVLRKVRPGNLDDLREAELQFNAIAAKVAG